MKVIVEFQSKASSPISRTAPPSSDVVPATWSSETRTDSLLVTNPERVISLDSSSQNNPLWLIARGRSHVES